MKIKEQFAIEKIKIPEKLVNSLEFFEARRERLKEFQSFDDFVQELIAESSKNKEISAFEYHLAFVRNEVLRELRNRDIYVGQSIIEELVFYIFREENQNPYIKIFGWIRNAGLHRPGLLIFALHSVGILGFGAFRALGQGDATLEFSLKQAGMVFAPQTNSKRHTAELIHRVTKMLGIKQKVRPESIEHQLSIPAMHWMTRNPLLFVRVHAVSGERFENQRFLAMKLRLATSFLIFIHTLEGGSPGAKTSVVVEQSLR